MAFLCSGLTVTHCTFMSQNGLEKKVDKSRKQMKERRKRAKKVRGVKKNAGAGELLCGARCAACHGSCHRHTY
jgi:hypothetical protein